MMMDQRAEETGEEGEVKKLENTCVKLFLR